KYAFSSYFTPPRRSPGVDDLQRSLPFGGLRGEAEGLLVSQGVLARRRVRLEAQGAGLAAARGELDGVVIGGPAELGAQHDAVGVGELPIELVEADDVGFRDVDHGD